MMRYDLREECVKKYGEDFGKKYDIITNGGTIGNEGTVGNEYDTLMLLASIEITRIECEERYNLLYRIIMIIGTLRYRIKLFLRRK